MQKNIFKKITSGMCLLALSCGICLASGPFEPPKNINVDVFTVSDCYCEYKEGIENKISPEGVMIRSYNTPYDKLKESYNVRTEASATPSVHTCVDQDQVYVCLPFNTRGWHCGGTCNNTHLTIMMIEPDNLAYNKTRSEIITDKTSLTDLQKKSYNKTYNTAVWLTAYFVRKFGMNLNDKLTVVGHCEAYNMTPEENRQIRKLRLASNMSTPNHVFPLFDLSMDQFREDVKNQVNYWNESGYSETEQKLIKNMEENLKKYTLQ